MPSPAAQTIALTRPVERVIATTRERKGRRGGVAVAVWALGDPEADAALDRLDAIYRNYHTRRIAAAARALEQS